MKPISSHTYGDERYVGEVQIEALVFGDEISTAAQGKGRAGMERHGGRVSKDPLKASETLVSTEARGSFRML